MHESKDSLEPDYLPVHKLTDGFVESIHKYT